ncbi:MAG: hypothetical protein Q8920_09290 [Bacillota bacterium]|nr:hypothetical protein [Bacillota bacterium]
MGLISERVAYLKGLAEGMKLNEESNEGKLLKAIIDVLDDVALSVEDVEDVQEALSQQVDEIDEDLSEIESILFDEEEDDDEDEECDCETEIECPYCNETICLEDGEMDEEEGTITCPSCKKEFDYKWECDCGCEHDDEK